MRLFSALLATALLTACPLHKNEADKKAKAGRQGENPSKDESGNVSFQAFIGRLRTAVAARDMTAIASMMTRDFGYRWDTPPPGDNVFAYWDQNNSWPKLNDLVQQKWVPYDGYMVVPPELAANPSYGGHRAGVKQVNGAWRFTYFVPAPPPEPELESPAPTSL